MYRIPEIQQELFQAPEIYFVTVTAESGRTWLLQKSYSDFVNLNQSLFRILSHHDRKKLSFPTVLKMLGKQDICSTKKRGPIFERYLNDLNLFSVWDLPSVKNFLLTGLVSLESDVQEDNEGKSPRHDRGFVFMQAVCESTQPDGDEFVDTIVVSFNEGDVFVCQKNELLYEWRFAFCPSTKVVGFIPSNFFKIMEY